jgi:hypothetical protein
MARATACQFPRSSVNERQISDPPGQPEQGLMADASRMMSRTPPALNRRSVRSCSETPVATHDNRWPRPLRRPARRTGWCGRRLAGPLTTVPVSVAVVVSDRPGGPAGLADRSRDGSQQRCCDLLSPTGAQHALRATAVGALTLHGDHRAPIARGFHACAHALRPVEPRRVHGPLDPVRVLVERRLAGHARQGDLNRPPQGLDRDRVLLGRRATLKQAHRGMVNEVGGVAGGCARR